MWVDLIFEAQLSSEIGAKVAIDSVDEINSGGGLEGSVSCFSVESDM